MTDILTLTMNPALDVATSTDTVTGTHKLRCSAPRRFPGGGGINVARVAQRLGADCIALYPAGGAPGQHLRQLLEQEQVRSSCIEIGEETRESFSVTESSSGREFRFVLPGPTLTPQEWQACLDRFAALDPPPRYLVASGSLPPGVPTDFYARLVRLARVRGTQVVLDTSGPALAEALNVGVYLVKPSLRELREFSARPLTDEAQWRDVAQRMVASGQAQVVVLSLGEQGALLVAAGISWRASALRVPVLSATGAGDSFVGAIVWALSHQAGLAEAFRYGVAAGSASLLSAGTGLCSQADVARLYPEVRLTSE